MNKNSSTLILDTTGPPSKANMLSKSTFHLKTGHCTGVCTLPFVWGKAWWIIRCSCSHYVITLIKKKSLIFFSLHYCWKTALSRENFESCCPVWLKPLVGMESFSKPVWPQLNLKEIYRLLLKWWIKIWNGKEMLKDFIGATRKQRTSRACKWSPTWNLLEFRSKSPYCQPLDQVWIRLAIKERK